MIKRRGRHPWYASGSAWRGSHNVGLVVAHRQGEGAGIGTLGLGGAHVQCRADVERIAAADPGGTRAGVVCEGIDGHGIAAAGKHVARRQGDGIGPARLSGHVEGGGGARPPSVSARNRCQSHLTIYCGTYWNEPQPLV